jgi:hypothetical protein
MVATDGAGGVVTTTTTLPRSSASVPPERFAVEVTADDIAQGWPCNASQCPIALAVMRWLWEQNIPVVYVSVTDRDVEINLDWRTPALRYWHDAASFTTTYDRAEPVEPRTVVLARLSR